MNNNVAQGDYYLTLSCRDIRQTAIEQLVLFRILGA